MGAALRVLSFLARRPEANVDLLVLLEGGMDYFGELRALAELLYPVQLECQHLLSAKPATVDEYESGRLQLYRSAKREGVRI